MKRTGLILFAAFYLLSVVSFSVTAHFCGGSIKAISFLPSEMEGPKCCGMKEEMSADCCKDKTVTVKSSGQKHMSSSSLFPVAYAYSVPIVASLTLLTDHVRIVNTIRQAHSPPHPPNCPVHILNRVLLV